MTLFFCDPSIEEIVGFKAMDIKVLRFSVRAACKFRKNHSHRSWSGGR